jgi:radical SAM family uncharacterized protein
VELLELLHHDIRKPARYRGSEFLPAGFRPAREGELTVALVYPDLYEIGMSNTGMRILYSLLTRRDGVHVDTAFAPWPDMEKVLREESAPLVSRQGQRPLGDFDVLGFSLQYELNYTNVLTVLDLAGIPLRAADRTDGHPIILGGGPCATHPEPMAPFFDAFIAGDGEESLAAFLDSLAGLRAGKQGRAETLAALDTLPGVFVPHLHAPEPDPRSGNLVITDAEVRKQSLRDIDAYAPFVEFPVPAFETVFDRVSLELARGCHQGCRFCEAGFTYRPPRERSPDYLLKWAEETLHSTGLREVSMASLSSADYSCILSLATRMRALAQRERASLAVSSLRAYGIDDAVLDALTDRRTSSLTLAPEAGSQRLRNLINKNVTREQILDAVRRIVGKGINRIKLYFMIGLPTETEEDLEEMAALIHDCYDVVRTRFRAKGTLVASVSLFVPRPHTPFQWEAMAGRETLEAGIQYLRNRLRRKGITFRWHSPEMSWLEAIFTRGDRSLADVIEGAWRRGARFDSWDELLRLDAWRDALAESGIDGNRFLHQVPTDTRLPWSHIHIDVTEAFLRREHDRALEGKVTKPCDPFSEAGICYQCGALCPRTGTEGGKGEEARKAEEAKEEGEKPFCGGAAAVDSPVLESGPSASFEPPDRDRAKGNGKGEDVREEKATEIMAAPVRYRVGYRKVGDAVLLGHLDLQRHLILACRRAGISLDVSKGFNPRPRLYFAAPLALGQFGLDEYADIIVAGPLDDAAALAALNRGTIPGIEYTSVVAVTPEMPKVSRVATAVLLLAPAAGSVEPAALVEGLLAMGSEHLQDAEVVAGLPDSHLPPAPAGIVRVAWGANAPRIDKVLAEQLPEARLHWVARERLIYA